MAKVILKALNGLVSCIIFLALSVAALYSVYALWDNHRVYAAADHVRADLLALKPNGEVNADTAASFDALKCINPDVCAWLAVDNTGIDYPVLQGENNLSYINTDVYGSFALSGSIFLDSRCDMDFTDCYSLLYGHHMENSKMFGDLDLFRDASFFSENSSGTLSTPERVYSVEIFASIVVPASDKVIFEPRQWRDDPRGLLEYARDNSVNLRQSVVDRLSVSTERPLILGMSTCAADYTDARTVVLAVLEEQKPEKQRNENEKKDIHITGDDDNACRFDLPSDHCLGRYPRGGVAAGESQYYRRSAR